MQKPIMDYFVLKSYDFSIGIIFGVIVFLFAASIVKGFACKNYCYLVLILFLSSLLYLFASYNVFNKTIAVDRSHLTAVGDITHLAFAFMFLLFVLSEKKRLMEKPAGFKKLFIVLIGVFILHRGFLLIADPFVVYLLLVATALFILSRRLICLMQVSHQKTVLFEIGNLLLLGPGLIKLASFYFVPTLATHAHYLWLGGVLGCVFITYLALSQEFALEPIPVLEKDLPKSKPETSSVVAVEEGAYHNIESRLAALDEDGKQFIEKVNQKLEDFCKSSKADVEELCGTLGISRSQLHRKMKGYVGLSVSQYIRFYKIKKSLPLLEEDTLSIKEVAFKTGFNSVSYFTRTFTEFLGYPPSKFSI